MTKRKRKKEKGKKKIELDVEKRHNALGINFKHYYSLKWCKSRDWENKNFFLGIL